MPKHIFAVVRLLSSAQPCVPTDRSTPSSSVLHCRLEFAHIQVHCGSYPTISPASLHLLHQQAGSVPLYHQRIPGLVQMNL